MSSDFTVTNESCGPTAPTSRARRVASILAICLAISACESATDQTPILAETMKPPPQTLVRMFANRTEGWDSGSGSYYGADGTWRAVNTTEQSLGLGRWYVTTQSKLCTESIWRWRQDFGTETGEKITSCRYFRKDPNGQLWSTSETANGPWYPFNKDGVRRGNQISTEFNRLARYLEITKTP